MDFFEIHAFYELSKTLHFSKAAALVHLSPSALSRLVMRLEEEMGVQLLNRDTRQVQLTDEGRHFVRFAERVLHQKEALNHLYHLQKESLVGTLRMYASVTACYTILPSFIESISKHYPDIKLIVETGDPALATKMVQDDFCDLAVSAIPDDKAGQISVHQSLEAFPVKTSPLVFVAKTESAYENLTKDEFIEKASFILPKRGLARNRFDREMKQHPEIHIAAETAGNEAVLALTRLGLGIGLVPKIVLENGPFFQGLTEFPSDFCNLGNYHIGFVMKKDIRKTQATARIMEAVKEIIHKIIAENAK